MKRRKIDLKDVDDENKNTPFKEVVLLHLSKIFILSNFALIFVDGK